MASADGSTVFLFHPSPTGGDSAPLVAALDLRRGALGLIGLPAEMRAQGEDDALWAMVLSPAGTTLYVANGASGAIAEIDARAKVLRRVRSLAVSSTDCGVLGAVSRFLLPVAEAKRYVRTALVASADGATLYVAGRSGVLVVDAATLRLRARHLPDVEVDDLALSPDGARLYVLDDTRSKITILDVASGQVLGGLPADRGVTFVGIDRLPN